MGSPKQQIRPDESRRLTILIFAFLTDQNDQNELNCDELKKDNGVVGYEVISSDLRIIP